MCERQGENKGTKDTKIVRYRGIGEGVFRWAVKAENELGALKSLHRERNTDEGDKEVGEGRMLRRVGLHETIT